MALDRLKNEFAFYKSATTAEKVATIAGGALILGIICAAISSTVGGTIARAPEGYHFIQLSPAEQQKAAQATRDSGAELYSYWSTTLRVDTDINSSWLPNEERTCQTYPDVNGKVSRVICDQTESHRDHNIPVKFWGGVNRNTVSDWKCRREKYLLSDQFVCRALD